MDLSQESSQLESEFQTFFRAWITRQERLLEELLRYIHSPVSGQQDESSKQLINRVMTHYYDYYNAKSQICRQNVFMVLSPPWLSSYERSLLWVGGFKPGLAIRVVNSCGFELGPDRAERMERLAAETEDEEREMSEWLRRVDEQVSAPPMVALARMGGREVNGMVHDVEAAVERLAEAMAVLVECADCLREKTVAKVVGILTTAETVRFLAAMGQLQLRIRTWGQMRDAAVLGGATTL